MSDVTQILEAIDRGDQQASEQLLPLVYEHLRVLARTRMAGERADHTLQATDLVHEAYVRLVDNDHEFSWKSRGHFFRAAAEAMRRILVDHARRKLTVKRGGHVERVPGVSDIAEPAVSADEEERLLAVSDALDALRAVSERRADLVKLRYFAGLTIEEAAQTLEISVATAKRDWAVAKVFIFQQLAN